MSETGEEQLSLREYSKLEKMRRIREATEQLLAENSISDITMKDIARVARVGEATLFRYVGAKEELLLLVFGNRMEQYIADIESDEQFRPREDMSGDEIVTAICELYHGAPSCTSRIPIMSPTTCGSDSCLATAWASSAPRTATGRATWWSVCCVPARSPG